MRILKLALISFILFFLLMTGISLFIPSTVRVSKAINIQASPDSLWAEVDDFEKWKEWNPMISDSSHRVLEISADRQTANTAGTTIHWVQKTADERIVTMSTGNKPPVQSVWKLINYSASDSTTLHWYMDFKLRWYPWEKFSSLMLEKSYGPAMERGLANLKRKLQE
jgi:hypothetical protein